MVVTKLSVDVTIQKRFVTHDFDVTSSLAGTQHTFMYEGYNIKITLPKKPTKIEKFMINPSIRCTAWNKNNQPRGYSINEVKVDLDTDKQRLIPNNPLKRRTNSLFNKSESAKLEKLKLKYEVIINESFNYWVDIIRWKTKTLYTCRYPKNIQKTQHSVRLLDTNSQERFYDAAIQLKGSMPRYISKKEWNAAQKALSNQYEVPIWHIYLAESDHQWRDEQYRRAIIDLAIASEALVRELSKIFLSNKATHKYHQLADSIPISRLLNEWKRLGFNSTRWLRINNELNLIKKIFELRNAIMHKGQNPNISEAECRQFIDAVKKFIDVGDSELDKH